LPARRARWAAPSISGSRDATTGALSAPIYDRALTIQYCVIVAGPVDRIRDRLKTVSSTILEAARDMSSKLGYVGPYPALMKDSLGP
jgi:DNA-binding IclR family transcriptional regulator